MKKLKALLDLKKVSVFLIALPYLAFNYEKIIHSPFYSFTQLVLILASILLVDLFIKYGLLKLNDNLNNANLNFGETDYGWKGDVPVILLSNNKIKSIGWNPKYNSTESINIAIDWMIKNLNN